MLKNPRISFIWIFKQNARAHSQIRNHNITLWFPSLFKQVIY